MGNKLQPTEAECWVELWAQILEKISHTEENEPLRLLIKAIGVVNCGEYIHQHPMVRSLVEFSLLRLVVFIEYLPDELKHLGHELMLVETEHFQQDYYQLDEAVDIAEVQTVRRSPLAALVSVVESFLDTCLHHHSAEAEEELRIRVDAHAAEILEKSVDLFLLVLFVVNVGHDNPFDEEFTKLAHVFLVVASGAALAEVQSLQDILAELANLLMVRHQFNDGD